MRIDILPMTGVEAPAAPAAKESAGGVSAAQAATGVGGGEFRQLFSSLYDGALITRQDGAIVEANTRVLEFLGCSQAEIGNRNVVALISGADHSLLPMLREALSKDRYILIQAHCVRQNGSLFPAEIAVNELHISGYTYLCFFVRDVTLRKRAEDMLRTEHNAIQNAGNGIAIADLRGRLEYVNPATSRLWGFGGAEDMRGKPVSTLFRDKDGVQRKLETVLRGQGWNGETVAVRRDGSEFYVQVEAAANRDSDEQVEGLVLSFVDVSDRRRAIDAERQTERQQVMVESLGTACHHLGQPATVLLASLEMMQKMLDTNPGMLRELVDSSMEAAESMRSMLHDLNTLTEYRTRPYLEGSEGLEGPETRILDLREAATAPGDKARSANAPL